MTKSKLSTRASLASKCLESTWRMIMDINRKNVKIPLVVITILSAGDRIGKHGHHSPTTWRYRGGEKRAEVGISPGLFKTPEIILAVMLHEAAHAALSKNHKAGMGSAKSYHTKIFRETCFKLGLQCEFYNTRHGWMITSWPNNKHPNRYISVVKYLKQNLPMGTSGGWVKLKGRKLPKSGHIRLECKCKIHVGNSILVTKTMLKRITEKRGIKCEICDALFVPIKTK